MKRDIDLSYGNNTFADTFGYTVKQITIFNYTSGVLYIRGANNDVPTITNYDYKVLPNTTLHIPVSTDTFSCKLDYAIAPSDLNEKCKIIFMSSFFLGNDNNTLHYEVRLNSVQSSIRLNLPFMSQSVLILNYGIGTLYISRGNDYIPDTLNYDYLVNPDTILIIPVTSKDFCLNLDGGDITNCIVIFTNVGSIGYVNYSDSASNPECPDCPEMWEHYIDFRTGTHGFSSIIGTHTMGVGWVCANGGGGNYQAIINNASFAYSYYGVRVDVAANPTGTRSILMQDDEGIYNQSFFQGTIYSDYWFSSTEHTSGSMFLFLNSSGVQGTRKEIIGLYLMGWGVNPFI